MTAAYVVEDLVFSYGKHPALTVEKLEIPPGKIIALVGPNGSGKTTLLHVLAFLLIPHQGRIFFFGDGSTNKNLLPFRRRVGLLLRKPLPVSHVCFGQCSLRLKNQGHEG